jgi:hypothetical protein
VGTFAIDFCCSCGAFRVSISSSMCAHVPHRCRCEARRNAADTGAEQTTPAFRLGHDDQMGFGPSINNYQRCVEHPGLNIGAGLQGILNASLGFAEFFLELYDLLAKG